MRYSYAIGTLALAAGNALAAPQGVTSAIAPQASAPAGCSTSHSGQFQITVVNVTSSHAKRDALEITLTNGVLKDASGRTGYIASNYQFQFDGPPQAGAIYTSGFSLCGNGSLALGSSTIWYQCLSGGFYNLYDRSWAAQCSPIYIKAIGTTVLTSVSQRTDGQPIVTTAVSQRTDGQVIATTAKAPGATPVSQISDGQVQGLKATTVTGAPVSQISDGQIQASPVSQISDGQIQATTAAPVAVSQQTNGQIIATNTKAAVSNNVTASAAPSQVTVAAAPAMVQAAGSAAFAGVIAVVAALL
jgi:hypothetical protein